METAVEITGCNTCKIKPIVKGQTQAHGNIASSVLSFNKTFGIKISCGGTIHYVQERILCSDMQNINCLVAPNQLHNG